MTIVNCNQDSEKIVYQDKIYKMLETNNFAELNNTLYTIFASLGLEVIAEDTTNKGRRDLTLKFPGNEKVYIFEFKVLESVKDKRKGIC